MGKKATTKEIIAMYQSGMEIDAIVNKLGYKNAHFVRYTLRHAGVMREERLDTGKVLALYKAGWTPAKIAMDMNVPEKQVQEVIDDYY